MFEMPIMTIGKDSPELKYSTSFITSSWPLTFNEIFVKIFFLLLYIFDLDLFLYTSNL